MTINAPKRDIYFSNQGGGNGNDFGRVDGKGVADDARANFTYAGIDGLGCSFS